MLNKIWFWLLVIGIVYGFGKGAWRVSQGITAPVVTGSEASSENAIEKPNRLTPLKDAGQALNDAVIDAAATTMTLAITLIGVMALWLGMMNIARDSGLIDALARLMRPMMRWLFPDVPDGHPAQGAILMNLSANMLGLDNAATPFGLKAMRELQTLNPAPDTATNSMSMFLAINTSSVTLVPISIIGLRAAAGSENPAAPIGAILFATLVSTLVAIFVTRMLSRWPRFAPPAPVIPAAQGEA